jgi:hypothetical protein
MLNTLLKKILGVLCLTVYPPIKLMDVSYTTKIILFWNDMFKVTLYIYVYFPYPTVQLQNMSINCALHTEGLQNPFHVKWMHINIYLYVAITSIHKAWYLYMWKNRIRNKRKRSTKLLPRAFQICWLHRWCKFIIGSIF